MNIQLSRMYFQNVEIKRTIDALYCGVLLLTPNAQKLADSLIAMETKTEKAFAVIFTLHVEKQLFERTLPLTCPLETFHWRQVFNVDHKGKQNQPFCWNLEQFLVYQRSW